MVQCEQIYKKVSNNSKKKTDTEWTFSSCTQIGNISSITIDYIIKDNQTSECINKRQPSDRLKPQIKKTLQHQWKGKLNEFTWDF